LGSRSTCGRLEREELCTTREHEIHISNAKHLMESLQLDFVARRKGRGRRGRARRNSNCKIAFSLITTALPLVLLEQARELFKRNPTWALHHQRPILYVNVSTRGVIRSDKLLNVFQCQLFPIEISMLFHYPMARNRGALFYVHIKKTYLTLSYTV